MRLHLVQTAASLTFLSLTASQQIASDPGRGGASLELVHLYNDLFPVGIAVSSTGRKFSTYARSLDPNNIAYTVAELVSNNTERAYPSAEINTPPGGAINYTTTPPSGANYPNYFIGAQGVVIDSKDRLWILDTGRAATPEGINVPSTPGGPKLVGINLTNDTIFQTILFPPDVAFSDSYINDIRFDLRPSVTASGKGIAYITDSSQEGRNGIIIVDLGTGESWRHLDNTPEVRAQRGFLPFIWGEVVYSLPRPGQPITFAGNFGADGIALSADGETLFWSAVGSRTLYSIPTERLRDRSLTSEIMAEASVVSRGEKGISDGLETDSNGLIYTGNFEDNAINVFNPANGTVQIFSRDPRLGWTDTFAVATDGYVYFTENQLWRTKSYYPGTDRRVKPYVLFRAKCPGNGTKVNLQ
ncbi:MAG: hypothetical protein L6R40_004186 [Gallowayella cf. fulva]|nr:MAG: hypothetical protein L6R40_004186 [Xanthomendoza cf. fulva]